jgi:hypothetical protein
MNKFFAGLVCAAFFVLGDVAYALFQVQSGNTPEFFFGVIIAVLLFFVLHKLDRLLSEDRNRRIASIERTYTNWLVSAILGACFAFSSNGSILLRWIFG